MTQLVMFSIEGVRGTIEGLVADLRTERTKIQQFNVEDRVQEITGQMRRLLKPIPRPDKGAEFLPPMIPAESFGIPEEKITRVDNLIAQSFSAYRRNDSNRAIELANEALGAWNE